MTRVDNSPLRPPTFFCHMRPSFCQNFCCPQHVKNVPSTKILLENEPWKRWSIWRMSWPNQILHVFHENPVKIVTKFFWILEFFLRPQQGKKDFRLQWALSWPIIHYKAISTLVLACLHLVFISVHRLSVFSNIIFSLLI